MKIATWNVNSIRQREKHVARWLEQCQPDVLLLQEIKCEAPAFPALTYHGLGYKADAVGQKAYNGVAVLSRLPFTVTHRALPGLPSDDAQSRYIEVEGSSLKDEETLLKLCAPNARPRHTLVLLDGRGKQLSSEELAKFLGDYQDRNPLPLLFAVGGADGFSDQVRQAATLVLSLGKMTLAHELARVVLLEQLYRAFTILKSHPYHTSH